MSGLRRMSVQVDLEVPAGELDLVAIALELETAIRDYAVFDMTPGVELADLEVYDQGPVSDGDGEDLDEDLEDAGEDLAAGVGP